MANSQKKQNLCCFQAMLSTHLQLTFETPKPYMSSEQIDVQIEAW